MNQNKKKYQNKITLKVNENNNLDSIIEIFQQFNNKYNIIVTKLNKFIQYQTEKQKITQTYKTTLVNANIDEITNKLKKEGKVTIIIIDNLSKKDTKKKKKIQKITREINKLENIKTKTIKQKDTFKTIDSIIQSDLK